MKDLVGYIEFEKVFTLFNNKIFLHNNYNKKYNEMQKAYQRIKDNEKAFSKISYKEYKKLFEKYDLFVNSELPIKYRFLNFYIASELEIGIWVIYKTTKNNDFSNNKEFKMSYDDFLKLLLQDKIELIKRNDI